MSARIGPAVEPRGIQQAGDESLDITWSDGISHSFRAAELRRACPCAVCVNEWTGARVLNPESISEDLKIVDVSIVGRYALNFKWSDLHETGIYSFRYLRELGER